MDSLGRKKIFQKNYEIKNLEEEKKIFLLINKKKKFF